MRELAVLRRSLDVDPTWRMLPEVYPSTMERARAAAERRAAAGALREASCAS